MVDEKSTNKYLKGSITVEVSYISVFIIFIIVLMLYTSFYCHDRAAMRGDAVYLAQLMTSSSLKWLELDTKTVCRKDEFSHVLEDRWVLAYNAHRQYIIEEGRRLVQGKMLFSKIKDISIDCSYSSLTNQLSCTVYISGYLKFPLKLFGKSQLGFEETCKISEFDAIKVIWLKKMLKGRK